MRMMKRVAVGILTAAMALSMLTACGGGGSNASSGTKPSSGNNSSTNGSSNAGTSSSNSGTTNGNTNSSSGSSDTTKLPDNTEIKYANSLTRKWNLLRSNSDKLYIKTEYSSGSQNVVSEEVYSGKKRYYKSTYTVDSSTRTSESFYDGQTSYSLYPDAKIAVVYVFNNSSSGTSGETYTLSSMKKTTHIENNTSYYTEVMTYTGKTSGKTITHSYSFDTSGKLVYMYDTYLDGQTRKTHVLSYGTSIPSSAILEIPKDWDIYTITYGDSDSTITAPDGHTLTNEEVSAFYRKINN